MCNRTEPRKLYQGIAREYTKVYNVINGIAEVKPRYIHFPYAIHCDHKSTPKPTKQHQSIANVITKGRVPNFLLYT